MIFCLLFGDSNLSLGISLSCSSVTVYELFFCQLYKVFGILLVILSPIRSPVFSAVLWINLFVVVFFVDL